MPEQYDDIIVGAGSSGAVLASRLTEDPNRTVLLLEAGPDYADGNWPRELTNGATNDLVSHDWGYEAATTPGGTPVPFPRGKVVGGSSAVNGAVAYRGAPSDFDKWAEHGLDQWTWDSVLPYFKKLEDDPDGGSEYHNEGGPIPINRTPFGERIRIQAAYGRRTRQPRLQLRRRPQRPDLLPRRMLRQHPVQYPRWRENFDRHRVPRTGPLPNQPDRSVRNIGRQGAHRRRRRGRRPHLRRGHH